MTRRKPPRLEVPADLETYKSREAWEKARNTDPERLGASDVANLWGLGYGSPLSLWQEVLRRRRNEPAPPIEPDLADRFALGSYLEPYVRQLAARELGRPVLAPHEWGAKYHRFFPDDDPLRLDPAITRHLAVTLDGITTDHDGGAPVPVELKTVDVGAAAGWPLDRPHPAAALQAATQAVVIGASHAYVFAMIGYGTGEKSRRLYRVEVPPGFSDELGRRLLAFFRHVEANEPPEVLPEDHERITKMFPVAVPGKTVWLPLDLARTILEREDLKAKMTDLGKQVDLADGKIKLAMRDAEVGIVTGSDLAVAYPTITRVEKPRLEEKVTTFRRLSIRQAKRDEILRAETPGEE